MDLVEVRGNNLREALERASQTVGSDAVVVARKPQHDGSMVLELRPTQLGGFGARRSLPRPGTADVARFLQAAGTSSAVVDRVCEAVLGRIHEGLHPLDLAAEEIGLMFPVARIPRSAQVTRVLGVLGTTGVGKTTSLIKLAVRMHQAKRGVAFLTLAEAGAGLGHKHLGPLDLPHFALRGAGDIERLSAELQSVELLLLDSSGSVEADVHYMLELRQRFLAQAGRFAWTTGIVLPATASIDALEQLHSSCQALSPDLALITKLDETKRVGPVLEYVLHHNLPVAFLADGPRLECDFYRAAPQHFADLLLAGRIRR